MAFDTARLEKIWGGGGVAGISGYAYVTDGTDTLGSCEESGYFHNVDDFVNFRVGDEIKVWVPGTETDLTNAELKAIVDYGVIIVMSVSTAGVVDCSADMLAGTLTYT